MSNWHHSPVHRLTERGAYMVTAGTYQKKHTFDTPEKLAIIRDSLLSLLQEQGWNLCAWAVLSNHYHFVAVALEEAKPLRNLIQHLHSVTARKINAISKAKAAASKLPHSERRIWFQYWETQLTYKKSYFSRLNYVHNNPVHHKIVVNAEDYEWCSAKWFRLHAGDSFFRTVSSFKFDKVNVKDDF